MTKRERLLAILKEQDAFAVGGGGDTWVIYEFGGKGGPPIATCNIYAKAIGLCTDLNTRHRLKRLCEEIAGELSDLPSINAILSLGEDNDTNTTGKA